MIYTKLIVLLLFLDSHSSLYLKKSSDHILGISAKDVEVNIMSATLVVGMFKQIKIPSAILTSNLLPSLERLFYR